MIEWTDEDTDALNYILEQFYSHISSVKVSLDGSFIAIDVEVPLYIFKDNEQRNHLRDLLEKHIKITHAIQEGEFDLSIYPSKTAGDLDDYLTRNY